MKFSRPVLHFSSTCEGHCWAHCPGDHCLWEAFPLPPLHCCLRLPHFSSTFLLSIECYKYPYCQTALFFLKSHNRSFFLALSMLSISSILLAKFLCYICLQGIIKATAHYVLSIYGARKSHIKKCGVYCVRIYSHMYAFTHETCKNNMC